MVMIRKQGLPKVKSQILCNFLQARYLLYRYMSAIPAFRKSPQIIVTSVIIVTPARKAPI